MTLKLLFFHGTDAKDIKATLWGEKMGCFVNGVCYCDECGKILSGHVESNGKYLCISCSFKEDLNKPGFLKRWEYE
jgi:hypothetical protein